MTNPFETPPSPSSYSSPSLDEAPSSGASSGETSPHAPLLPLYMGLAFLGVLAIGVITGFLVRPLIIPDRVDVKVVEVVPTAALSQAQTATQKDSEADTTPAETESNTTSDTSTASNAAPTPTIMDFLMADARHILGADDAPVTIIEFSDFK